MTKKKKEDSNQDYKPTCHKFVIDFLNAEVLVSIGTNIIEAVRLIDPTFTSMTGLSEGQLSQCDGLTIRGDDHYVLAICLEKDADINVIVHECIHAMNYIIEWYDLPLDTEEDEIQAYLGAFFVDRVIDAIEQNKQENINPDKKKKS